MNTNPKLRDVRQLMQKQPKPPASKPVVALIPIVPPARVALHAVPAASNSKRQPSVTHPVLQKFKLSPPSPLSAPNPLPTTIVDKPKQHFLSVCVNVRDEEHYIQEFIAYYRLMGVDHFFIYDNDSKKPVGKLLTIQMSAYCTVIRFPGDTVKFKVLQHFLTNYAHRSKWVASVDIDEFIFVQQHNDLKSFIRSLARPGIAGITMGWTLFGYNNHQSRPVGLVTQQYTQCSRRIPGFQLGKSITRTSAIVAVGTAHEWRVLPTQMYVDPLGRPIKNQKVRPMPYNCDDIRLFTIAQINHYYSRSRDEYAYKMNRSTDDPTMPKRDQAHRNLPELMSDHADYRLSDRYHTKMQDAIAKQLCQAPPA